MTARRRALVTGGGQGIGLAIALALARDGSDVAVLDRMSAERGVPLVQQVEAKGRRGMYVTGDVRDPAAFETVFETMLAQWSGVDILVNNAGIVRDQVIWKMTDEAWREVIDVNLTGVFNGCRAAIPFMRRGGWGAIINITSINGMRGKLGQANYTAAKAGVIGLTKTLAREAARHNITVNAVAPGLIATDLIKAMPNEAYRHGVEEILLGRPGRAEDVAEAVAFLASDRARFITGEVLRVDGGQYL